jgi:hypothetical protein
MRLLCLEGMGDGIGGGFVFEDRATVAD